VNHRQAIAKDMDARKLAAVERETTRWAALATLKEAEAQQHHDGRRKRERVLDELRRKMERRIGYDRLGIDAGLLDGKEIDDLIELAVIAYVACKHRMPALAQHIDNGAAPSRRLPDMMRELLGLEERDRCYPRRLVTIKTAIGARMNPGRCRAAG
jgi:hypothetical protein